MEQPTDSGLWAPPVPCRWCRQPMPRGMDECPACGAPSRPGAGWLAARAASLGLHVSLDVLVLVGAAGLLYLLLPLSPVLCLFPLLFVGPGVRRARRRRRRRRTVR